MIYKKGYIAWDGNEGTSDRMPGGTSYRIECGPDLYERRLSLFLWDGTTLAGLGDFQMMDTAMNAARIHFIKHYA